MRHLSRWMLALAFGLLVILKVAGEDDERIVRVWKDATGAFRIEAEFIGATDATVLLRRVDNGKEIEVPLAKLSVEDVEVIRKLAPIAFAPVAKTPQTAKELEAAAAKRRYATDVHKMYVTFLNDPRIPEIERTAADKELDKWSISAAAKKTRCGSRWYTAAEYADIEEDELDLLESAKEILIAGDPAAVAKALQEAARINPNGVRASFRLGILNALHPQGRAPDDAEKEFRECIRRLQAFVPEDLTASEKANLAASYNNAALTCIRQRKVTDALAFWEKCTGQAAPSDEVIHNLMLLRAIGVSQARAAKGGANLVYLTVSERNRLDKLTAPLAAVTQAYDERRGWRYSRLATADDFDPVDQRLGETNWDPYDDPWCMACYGRNAVDCPVRGCARGGVRAFATEIIPNPTGIGGQVKSTPIRVKCKSCKGRGRVSCDYCEYGLDPRFMTENDRPWLIRYIEAFNEPNALK